MPTSGRYDYLDGIRALAIGSVLALHWFIWYVPFFRGGAIGVDVFFVLSGFIITTMLWKSPAATSLGSAWLAFVRRRVTRLYPALLGLVVGAVALYAIVPASGLAPLEVARRGALVLTQSTSVWAAQQEGSFWVRALEPFGHGWSLAVEWYFYLLWPLAVLGARARGWRIVELENKLRAAAPPSKLVTEAPPVLSKGPLQDELDALRQALAQEHAARVAAESGEELTQARAELAKQAALLEQIRAQRDSS